MWFNFTLISKIIMISFILFLKISLRWENLLAVSTFFVKGLSCLNKKMHEDTRVSIR